MLFRSNVKEIGISLITQTANLAPADKKIYALRDTISCTDSIPLIASSIMSKKIAAGANKIVLDVTCGSGAFMKTKEDAIELSKTMKEIGELSGKEVTCIITKMDEPLGKTVGNKLEIIETIEALKGNMEEDIKEVVLTLGSYILKLAGKGENIQENKNSILECIASGNAYKKFIQLIEKQGGDISYVEDIQKLNKAKEMLNITKNISGYIKKIDAETIGKVACFLGAGRNKKEDKIDMEAGIVFNKKVGDYIEKEEIIAILYTNGIDKLKEAKQMIDGAIEISNNPIEKENKILEII